ncbi:hypothetical protein [Microbispora bryophytorum]|uniref:Uncharacterized protein n=1 Tax=Microbispora bryophytorum TaxID=1460882 RepID=A0A8H9H956_9ACTN|nr:hypothetical protein [Microbispora bryophytorum]GGO26446.1 hypothetical protein GCM10011574_58850 [Microbispora bryophytorum]
MYAVSACPLTSMVRVPAAFMGVRGSRRTTTSSPPSTNLRHLHGFANGLELDRQAVNAGIIWAHVIR